MLYGFLILSVFVLIFNLDELFFDLVYIFIGRRRRQRIPIHKLYEKRPRQMAIFVPAYQESQVIGDMLRTTLRLVNYPLSRYHIFVGLYPNDPETVAAVEEVAEQFPNVHPVIGSEPGPTTKAANLNGVWRYVRQFEEDTGANFEFIVLHDAEDLIHPLSLRLYNYWADEVDMVQIPVLPVLPEPSLGRFFRTLTTATYADEFAESHLRRMIVREHIGRFVPSAGVGTALSRPAMATLVQVGNGEPFDARALTEDYTMALHLAQAGLSTRFFLEGVERIDARGRQQIEYIATREIFPNDFWAAVGQKTRWIYGIAFQSRQLLGNMENKFTLGQRFLLFHDAKGKFSHMLAPFIYSAPLWLPLIRQAPEFHDAWLIRATWLLIAVNVVLFLGRQLVRGRAVHQYYGLLHGVQAVLFPPLIPLRFLWGGIINFVATWRAWSLHLFGRTGGRPRWAKTEHTHYMPPSLVVAMERRLGDLLIERGDITPAQLQHALAEQGEGGRQLGEILVELDFISSDQLGGILAMLNKTWYLDAPVANWDPYLRSEVDRSIAYDVNAVPLLALPDELVVITTSPLSKEARAALQRDAADTIRQVLAPPLTVAAGLQAVYEEPLPDGIRQPRLGTQLVQSGAITVGELVDALQEQADTGQLIGDILVRLGYISERRLAAFVGVNGAHPAGATPHPRTHTDSRPA